jgi:hypothetical protein
MLKVSLNRLSKQAIYKTTNQIQRNVLKEWDQTKNER